MDIPVITKWGGTKNLTDKQLYIVDTLALGYLKGAIPYQVERFHGVVLGGFEELKHAQLFAEALWKKDNS